MDDSEKKVVSAVEGIPERLTQVKGSQSTTSFARFLGVGVSTLHNYENGRTPPVDFLLLVSEKTGTSIEWLLTGEGARYPVPAQEREQPRRRRVLVVDDKDYQRESVANVLEAEGYQVLQAHDVASSTALLAETPCEVIVTDLRMPNEDDGLRLLEHVRQTLPGSQTIIMTVHAATTKTAVEAVRRGAFDYLVMSRTFPNDLRNAVARAFDELEQTQPPPAPSVTPPAPRPALVGTSEAAEELRRWLARAVESPSHPLLLCGEPGVGKEFFARLVHAGEAERAGQPFLPVKCGALEPERLERELLGGAGGGAGVVGAAGKGTIFLDEIDRASPAVQIALYRLAQDRVLPLPDGTLVEAGARLICATHADLTPLVESGRLRREFYSLLSVLRVDMLPLRKRREDIPLLAEMFLEQARAELGKPIHGIEPDAMAMLVEHDWPDNIRGLRHVIQRAAVFCDTKTLNRGSIGQALGREVGR